MAYHASGKPTFHTGSIVHTPADVRASERYGAGVSATPYATTDRNGMSFGIVKDVVRFDRKLARARKVKAPKVRVWREDRAAKERRIIGAIGSAD